MNYHSENSPSTFGPLLDYLSQDGHAEMGFGGYPGELLTSEVTTPIEDRAVVSVGFFQTVFCYCLLTPSVRDL